MRFQPLDILRGFIMIVMAIDHCSALVAKVHYSEFWGVELLNYHNGWWTFTRLITHICAPGFVLLLGISMAFFNNSRLQKSWTDQSIRKFFVKRGIIIILITLSLEGPAWGLGAYFSDSSTAMHHLMPGGQSMVLWASPVIFVLGISMVITALLMRFKNRTLLSVAILAIVGSFVFIQFFADPNRMYNGLLSVLLIPGNQHHVFVLYSILPWVSVSLFGVILGRLILNNPPQIMRNIGLLGFSLLAFSAILRITQFGNFQMDQFTNWIDFFTLIKYPPSLVFLSFTLGINLVLIFLFSKLKSLSVNHPIIIFGRTALFFYVAHLYIYMLIGLAFPFGTNLIIMYLLWFIGLIPLYFMSKAYLKFKMQKPDHSIWKLF